MQKPYSCSAYHLDAIVLNSFQYGTSQLSTFLFPFQEQPVAYLRSSIISNRLSKTVSPFIIITKTRAAAAAETARKLVVTFWLLPASIFCFLPASELTNYLLVTNNNRGAQQQQEQQDQLECRKNAAAAARILRGSRGRSDFCPVRICFHK